MSESERDAGGTGAHVLEVECLVEDPRWQVVGIAALARRAVGAVLDRLAPGDWAVGLLACDDARIAALNTEFRGTARPTNVLSWPGAERGAEAAGSRPAPPDPDDPELGDLAIAFETCAAEAAAAGLPFADHVTHLLVHGTLHLLGYDHVRDADGDLMEATEREILEALDIADPYKG